MAWVSGWVWYVLSRLRSNSVAVGADVVRAGVHVLARDEDVEHVVQGLEGSKVCVSES